MKKMKLNKKIMQAAVFSSALTLYPQIAYGTTRQTESIVAVPSSLIAYGIMIGGFAITSYRDIKKQNKERLYYLQESIIPGENRIIKSLKKEAKKKNQQSSLTVNPIELELKTERTYLKQLEEEKKRLCQTLNIDDTNEEEMEAFIRKTKKKLESKKVKTKRFFAR